MSKINIQTLTPVHVGSGNLLQYNYDFVITKNLSRDEVYLRVLDDKKMLDLIGVEHLQDWMICIEREKDTKEMIKRFAPDAKPVDYSKRRIISCVKGINDTDSLKECIHDGRGIAYIPGSSIKGAIRTAIVASLAKNIPDVESFLARFVSASKVEKYLFGDDPQKDVFKYIRVGDSFFQSDCEIAMRMISLNITGKDSLIDKSKSQLIEAIGTEEESSFDLTIDVDKYRFAKSRNPNAVGELREEFASVTNLFYLINQHTRGLVEEEIKRWTEQDKTGAATYVDNMKQILDSVNSCNEGRECILRIGYASGWRFTTGAWTESLQEEFFYSTVVPKSRPRNERYEEYIFPKTRRIDSDSDLLGFVKLSVAE